MEGRFIFEAEPFEAYFESDAYEAEQPDFYAEFDRELEGFDPVRAGEKWQRAVYRSSPAYIRWVQQSLNQIMGLGLVVNGLMRRQTRRAIRSFQRRQGLPVTGSVEPGTERALMAATASTPPGVREELATFEAEWADEEWQGEIKRGSPEYIAWVQHSLNQILGLRLAVDGLMGTATRSAIRSFQQQNGLSADGVVGLQTEQKLIQAIKRLLTSGTQTACTGIRQPEVLEWFDFDSDKVKPHHQPQISQVAQCVVASQSVPPPIRAIRMVGHTDPVGSNAYNLDLSRRRAEQVRRSLQDNIDRLSPGLSGSISFTIEPRGEAQPIPGDAARSRRVEIFVPVRVTPPPPKGCPPFTSRVRLHLKILVPPKQFSIATMLQSMQQVYGPAGFLVEEASRETLQLSNLEALDIFCPGNPIQTCCPFPCATNSLNAEHIALFQHRNNVRTNELAVYFILKTEPGLNGCCAHPPGKPGVVVTTNASQWTLAHEVGHVLGLPHVNNSDRLMTGGGTNNITNPPPDLIPSEIQTMDQSNLTIPC